MRAILINPFERVVREVHVPAGYKAIQRMIGSGWMGGEKDAPFSQGPALMTNTISWVDDEGVFRPDQAWFRIVGFDHPLAGFMLIQGTDGPNEAPLTHSLSTAMVEAVVRWISPQVGEQMVRPVTVHTLGADMQPTELISETHLDLSQKRPL